ncbi:MAG: hypothetical protein WD049_03910 [Candidatus Paceibacterota bacterium]
MKRLFIASGLTMGEVNQVVKQLGGVENFRRLKNGNTLANNVRGLIEETEISPVLKPTGDPLVLPAQTGYFCVSDWFREGKMDDGVEIVNTNVTFERQFFDKVEIGIPEVELTPYALTKARRSPEIIIALGGEERAEISLWHLRRLMRRTQAGEPTVIQSGRNVFYGRDARLVLWEIAVYWNDDTGRNWNVNALSLDYPFASNRGDRVFSCDS